MTSKQRAKLKSIASSYETIFQIGKNGISQQTITELNNALEARELIKIKVLETCELSPKEASFEIAEKAECQVVQVIGTKIVLYKQNKNPKKRIIELDD